MQNLPSKLGYSNSNWHILAQGSHRPNSKISKIDKKSGRSTMSESAKSCQCSSMINCNQGALTKKDQKS